MSTISKKSMKASNEVSEWDLLDDVSTIIQSAEPSNIPTVHEHSNAPFIMQAALQDVQNRAPNSQYGLFGQVINSWSRGEVEMPTDKRLYMNCSAPFSAVLCGVQGSGKSHTLSTMLENLLIPRYKAIGSLDEPMSGLVLHFGEGGPASLPSEVAWLASCSKDTSSSIQLPNVAVYVSPSSINTMHKVYTQELGNIVDIRPLYFTEDELDAQAFLSMMSVNSSDSAPLYMQMILSTLRQMGENFTYKSFQKELVELKANFNPAQAAGLEQRMALLTAFLDPIPSKKRLKRPPRFAAGQLTIIDLSDPFIDSDSACGIFNIICRQFVRADVHAGKVLVIDEAHKYLSAESGSQELTQRILSIIRQQRHLGMRVIISTQEPTVLPSVIIDLCNVIVLHRFQSPAWWAHIMKHVSADFSYSDVFDQVVKLQTGQSVVLAPSAIGKFTEKTSQSTTTDTSSVSGSTNGKTSRPRKPVPVLSLFGRRYLICKTRRRVTNDGGASILATKQDDNYIL